MSVKRFSPILLAVLVLGLAGLACGAPAREATATPLPRPTQRPAATNTPPAEPTEQAEATATRARPTDEPATEPPATEDPNREAPFTLSDEPFVHETGAFSIYLPEGWEIEPHSNSVYVTSPDKVVAIEVLATNVGVPFDEETLYTYIQAVEDNWFATFDNYAAGDFEPQADGSIGLFKTLDLSDGTPQSVFSYYWQEGTVIYEQDFWVDSDQYDIYVDGLVEVANSMETDPDAGAQAELYGVTYAFTCPGSLCEFYVPYGWTYETSEGESTVVDRFTTPDGLSYVENITYDDGTEISKSAAGAFARALLQDYYEVTDIKITDDVVQPDGSERLVWHSPSQGIDGVSFFETRGTTFLLLTWIVDSESYDLYFPVWDSLVESYIIPEATEEG